MVGSDYEATLRTLMFQGYIKRFSQTELGVEIEVDRDKAIHMQTVFAIDDAQASTSQPTRRKPLQEDDNGNL